MQESTVERFQVLEEIWSFIEILDFLFIWDRVSLWSPRCPGTCSVDQAGLNSEICQPLSQVLGLKECGAITARLRLRFWNQIFKVWDFLSLQNVLYGWRKRGEERRRGRRKRRRREEEEEEERSKGMGELTASNPETEKFWTLTICLQMHGSSTNNCLYFYICF